MSSSQPRLINQRYALDANPQSGGMADVYKAIDMQSGLRQVAVKIFKHGTLEEDVIKEAFKREMNALKELKHPNIVELLDIGTDEETGHYFLVLEWMERNLQDVIKETQPEGWDDFAEAIALPLLEALAFAHTRNIIHRDIKPSNILVGDDNRPKLADFSISKLKRWLQPGRTLEEFVSRPYSPPEPDDGSYTYTRDVFGLGVLVLDALTDVDIFVYEDINKALENFDAPDEVLSTIESSVSFDPLERQTNAIILKSEIERIQNRRKVEWVEKKICYLQPTTKWLRRLQEELSLSADDLKNTLLEDLNTECGISPYKKENRDVSGQYNISGVNFSYHVTIDDGSGDHLVILNVSKQFNSDLERRREFSWIMPYEFTFNRPLNWSSIEGKQIIGELQQEVEEFQNALKEKEIEEREQHLFRVWGNILKAKTEVEKSKETPLEYIEATPVQGKRIRFELKHIPEDDLIGQPRKVDLPNQAPVSGEIEEVKDVYLTLVVDDGDPSAIPLRGSLVFDTYAARVALDRQKAALDAVRYDRATRSDLRHLLVHANDVKKPDTMDVQFIQYLDSAKQAAVRTALGAEDFLLVEGPPGTGKTTFIAEIILQTLKQNPEARILLSSQTHVALDNGLEKICELNPNLKMARIGRIGDMRISSEMSKLLLENQMDSWSEDVFTSGDKYLKNWATEKGVSADDVELAIKLEELSFVRKEIQILESECQEIQSILDRRNLRDDGVTHLLAGEKVTELQEKISRIQSRVREHEREQKDLQNELRKRGDDEADLVEFSAEELDEWVQDLIPPDREEAHVFKQLLKIHAEWQSRFGKDPEFLVALLTRSQVIAGTCIGIAGIKGIQDLDFDLCIIDEASKATATEMLVPMSRSKRWIVVGDPKQLPPFEGEIIDKPDLARKYDLDPQDIKRTLFDHLLETLPAECKKILSIQHRMVAPIGDLISECFYDGKLESAKKDTDDSLQIVLPKPVTWFSSSNIGQHQEKRTGSSFTNPCEAEIVRVLLNRLNFVLETKQKVSKVAILTGYSSQRMVLDRSIQSEKHNWEHLEVDVNTVDAFQGREADIAIYTVTRSNEKGNIGFLRDWERLNVALSRGKVALVIIGDHVFCRTSKGDNPLKSVIDYIEEYPEDCTIELFNIESN